jgi:hypothetical protein
MLKNKLILGGLILSSINVYAEILYETESIRAISSCANISDNAAVFQKDIFCESAYSYYNKLKTFLGEISPGAHIKGNFIYYEHKSSKHQYAPNGYNQTQLSCSDTNITQIDKNARGVNIYLDNFPNANRLGDKGGLGNPLCQFIEYIGTVEQTQNSWYSKQPMDYFGLIISKPEKFGQDKVFAPAVGNLSADAKSHYIKIGGKVNSMYIPNQENMIFSQSYLDKHKNDKYSAYWGMSAGGGSGAGFQVYLYKSKKPSNQDVVFTGGFGGGGGFVSPEFNFKEGKVNDTVQVSIGSGGGGGLQFSNSSNQFNLQNGLGLGAGTSSDERQVEYSYYLNPNTVYEEYNKKVVKGFQANLEELASIINQNEYKINIRGGGGMGVGAEYLYLVNQNETVSLEEYLPHVLSSEGGFSFTITLLPKDSTDSLVVSNDIAITQQENSFYQNLGAYYNTATKLALKKTKGRGAYSCAVYMCKSTQQYVLDQAKSIFGGLDKVPSWVKIDQCKFSKYVQDPSSCPTMTTEIELQFLK